MNKKTKYLDVIIPLPLRDCYTYSTNYDNIKIGQLVVVQFGNRKFYSAVIKSIHYNKPKNYEVKSIITVLDESSIVDSTQLEFWDWMANYYMCSLGEIMNAALPAYFRLASETQIVIHPKFDGELNYLSENEIQLLDLLSFHYKLNLKEISKLLNQKQVFKFINNLLRREVIQIQENLNTKYKQKIVNAINLNISKNEIDSLSLTTKQIKLVYKYLELIEDDISFVTVSTLLQKTGFSRSVLNTLVKKKIFNVYQKKINRFLETENKILNINTLTDFQSNAYSKIKREFEDKNVCLLYGVTSSGKTEVYIKMIKDQLKLGKQVLYLLPEIALTNQIIKRLKKYFGNNISIASSFLNSSEKVEIWKSVQSSKNARKSLQIILGTRSSIFMPFYNLGLIIVDEEHDSSFKQHQRNPRYNARDSVIYLANLHNAKVLLGTATPSLESFLNAKNGKYGLVEMHKRYSGVELPKIEIIDINKAFLKKEMVNHFSFKMIKEIKNALIDGKQIILFQNRRGFSSYLSCSCCAYTPKCKKCDVSLTYHKKQNILKCHYCGYFESKQNSCLKCNNQTFVSPSFGTEQIEECLKNLFPDAVTRRMDYDTTRGKYAYKHIIDDFEKGIIDILVGTQMVTKGLDFDNVSLVGVLNADSMLHFPDFRSYERAFQLMTQVAGRAGRKGKSGKVLIQTFDENNDIFKKIKDNDFYNFVKQQAKERKFFSYPPFTRAITIVVKNKNKSKLDISASILSKMLIKSFGTRVLGPEYPMISKIRNYYQKNIFIKVELESSVKAAKKILNEILDKTYTSKDFKSTRIFVDVDPY
tara:strand:- start:213 stop:2654 length:2442 start_codon:yes stop_codon:yes gene_type:complete